MIVTRVVSTTPCGRLSWSTNTSRSPTQGSGSPGRYSTARDDVAVFCASQHCSQEPIAETTITVVAEAQGLGHASILPALPITVRKTNRCREQVRRYREPGEEGSSRPRRGESS